MAWSIGSFTFATADEPDDGDVEFGSRMRWSEFNPIGYSGTILTYLGQSGARHRLHCRISETAMTDLKAIADAHQAVLFTATRPNLSAGVLCGITEFSALWNRTVPGDSTHADYWYDVWMTLVETGSA